MNSTAFLLLANSNPQVDKIQIPFGTVDFQPHQSSFVQVFESMDPSASEPKTVAMSESSEGSSSEVNLPVSLAEAEEGKITRGDKTMENLDLEAQLEDLMIHRDDTSDESTDTWKTGLELSEDDNLIFSSYNGKLDNRCQILAIIEDNSEELNENNNPVLNPTNINRGANHLAEGETADSLTTREKV
jgi:hypothetical protein